MISQHSVVALAVRDGASYELKVISCNISLDLNWAPYCQATIVVASPTASSIAYGNYARTLQQTDPFYNTRVQLYVQEAFGSSQTLGYLTSLYTGKTLGQVSTIWTGKTLGQLTALWYQAWNAAGVMDNVRRFFNLKVRSSSLDMETNQITLQLASDESLLQDYALTDTQPYAPNKLTAKTAVEYALGKIGAFLQAGASDAAITADASVWEPGEDTWNYLQSMLDQAQLRLYCDEQRRWYLTNTWTTGTTRAVAYGTDYITFEQTTTLDGDFYSAAVVKYAWTDDANVQQVAYDTYVNGRYNYVRVKKVTYNRRYPGAGAAKAIVDRKDQQTIGRRIQMVNNYKFTPGDNVTYTDNISYPPIYATTTTGRVTSVRWSLPNDRMVLESKHSHIPEGIGPAGGLPDGTIGESNTNMGA